MGKEGVFRKVVLAPERAGHELYVLHGYRGYPELVGFDVDAVSRDPGSIPRILSEAGVADVVQLFQNEATSFILRGRSGDTLGLLNPYVATALRWRERYLSRVRTEAREAAEAAIPPAPHELHDMPSRGLAASLAKLGFWWVDYAVFGYTLDVRPRLVRHALVMFDRYYDDLLVDPKRYRYRGPLWLARVTRRLVPRPLVVLLDASQELLWARKCEVVFEETARQRDAYLKLVRGLPNGYVVDASEPLDRVVANAESILLDYIQERISRRLGL